MLRTPYIVATVIFSCAIVVPFLMRPAPKPDPRILPSDFVDHSIDYSNILPGDYTGPATCAECHDEQHELWLGHPHSRMNRLPSPDSVQGDFDNASLKLPTGEIQFTTSPEGQYHMTVYKDGQVRRRYVVTRTVGSRYIQAYIGRQIEGPEPPDHDIYREHRLPFAYWFKLKRWVPRVYMNAYGDEKLVHGTPIDEAIDATPRVDTYSSSCMNCHNTFPYAYRIYHNYLVGFPDATVAAEIKQLAHALSHDIKVKPSIKSFVNLNDRLDPDEHLVTLGISCESCHFGGREHAIREREIKFLPTSKLTRISADHPNRLPNGRRDNAVTTRGICTQCHSGKTDLFPTGAGKSNSHEGLDLAAGACASQLSCIDCHEPHTGSRFGSGAIDQPRHIEVCASCHTRYQDEQFALSHSGHAENGAVNCLDCHMPKYTRGIDNLIRTHRIGLPVESSMVAKGMANACNACHLDKSLRWTLEQHQRIWGHAPHPTPTWDSFDSLDEPSGETWLNSADSHMRFLATQWLARSRWANEKFESIAGSLNDSEPVNRVFASMAVAKVLGLPADQAIGVDITAGPQIRLEQIKRWLREIADRQ